MSRRILVGSATALAVVLLSAGLIDPAAADWIDVRTGQRVASFPVITDPNGPPGHKTDWIRPDPSDHHRAFDPRTGRNFAYDPSRCIWIDIKTGERVADFPVITDPNGPPGHKTDWIRPDPSDRDHAFDPRAGRNFARVPCPQPTKTTETTPPPQPPAPPVRTASHIGFDPPPASYFGAPVGLSSATVGFDYARLIPKTGDDGDQWGFAGSSLFPLTHNFGLDIDAGYHKVSSEFFDLDNWTAGASLVWQFGNFRLGPSYGFQSNSANGFTVNTHNVGGFVDYFATPRITLSARGGGFWNDPGDDGYYIGGQLKGYVTPNFALAGMIDHTHFNTFQGFDENDYGLLAEYLFGDDEDEDDDCWWPPTSFWVNYDHTTFSPGSFHVDTIGFGIKLYTDGNGAKTLVDRQRTGVLTWQTFSPVALRF